MSIQSLFLVFFSQLFILNTLDQSYSPPWNILMCYIFYLLNIFYLYVPWQNVIILLHIIYRKGIVLLTSFCFLFFEFSIIFSIFVNFVMYTLVCCTLWLHSTSTIFYVPLSWRKPRLPSTPCHSIWCCNEYPHSYTLMNLWEF